MVLKTIHQKQSALITFLLMLIVVFLMFFCGLRYMDPPEEFGVAINFGTSDFGEGEPKLNKSIKSDIVKNTPQNVEQITEQVNDVTEEVISQDVEEAPVLKTDKKKQVKEAKPKDVKKKGEVKKTEKAVKEKPKPTKATQNVLSNLFGKKSEGEQLAGEGDDEIEGVKGSLEGEPSSDKYYGNNGLGGSGNYLLKGRKALSKPKRKPNCNEEGVVVVRIEVDNNGNVVKAVPGVKGTTNNSPCLLEPAKKAALSTKWNADGNAPLKQIGLIRYNFILSE